MGVDRPLAVDLLIKFANLGGESPPLTSPPDSCASSLGMSSIVCVCVCYYYPSVCACTSATGRTLPFVGTICCGPVLSWYVWVLKGGMMGIKRKVKV